MSARKSYGFALLLMLVAGRVDADPWKDWLQTCEQAAHQPRPANAPAPTSESRSIFSLAKLWLIEKVDERYKWEDCALQLFSLQPVSLTIGGVGPVSGLGAGPRAEQSYHRDRVQSTLVERGLIGLGGSYFVEGRYDLHMPTFGQWDPATATIPDQITLSVFARRADLRGQPFYGLGGDTRTEDKQEYRDTRDVVGVSAYVPLASALDVGGGTSYLRPSVTGVIDPQKPGVLPSAYLDSQAILRVHTPTIIAETWHREDLRLTYDDYHDLDANGQGFQRFQAFAVGSYELRRRREPPFDDSVSANFWCEQIPGKRCRFATLVIDGLVSGESAASGSFIPFYMQDTLGGTDRYGLDTLRGYDDYRFRSPARMLVQTELYKGIWGPIGAMLFADGGTVADRMTDLRVGQMRVDAGPGIVLRAGGNVVARGYVAYGPDGAHYSFKFTSAF